MPASTPPTTTPDADPADPASAPDTAAPPVRRGLVRRRLVRRGRGRVRRGRLLRAARGLTGVLAAGALVLAVAVVVAQWRARGLGMPGPGVLAVAGHSAAGVVAVVLQVLADRASGWRAWPAVLGVLVVASASLLLWWLT